jgi:hypothetical protein
VAYRIAEKGLIFVTYHGEEDLDPTRQGPLVQLVESECAKGPVAIVFEVTGARNVDPSVPAMWLKVTGRLAPALCTMAIASASLVVRVAADGFAISNVLRRVPISVKSFEETEHAMAWARVQVTAAAVAAAKRPG